MATTAKNKKVENEEKAVEVSEKKETKAVNDEKNRIAELEATIANMQTLLTQLALANQAAARPEPTSSQEITIICNFNGGLQTNFPTWSLSMSKFGQKVIITRFQFQELVNAHRAYFDKEYILLDSKHVDVAEQLGVPIYDKTSKKYIRQEDFDKIPNMTVRELEDYYLGLSEPMQRTFLSWYMNKCYDKTPGFYTVDKMTLLNNMCKGNLFDLLIKLCVSDNQ